MEITLDRILAILGIVFGIVLVVLDKAGKLKGQVLYLLLGIAVAMLLPLALGNSWVAHSSGMRRFSKGMLMVCLVRGIYAILAIWISPLGDKHTEDDSRATPAHPETYLQFARTAFQIPANGHRIFVAGHTATVTMVVQNAASVGVARDAVIAGGLAFIAPGEGLGTKEEDKFNQFRSAWLSQLPKMKGDEIGAGDNRVRDIATKPLQKELVSGLENEQVYLYFFGIIKWMDETGTWETQSCSHLLVKRSDLKSGNAVWKQCESGALHNFIRHPFLP